MDTIGPSVITKSHCISERVFNVYTVSKLTNFLGSPEPKDSFWEGHHWLLAGKWSHGSFLARHCSCNMHLMTLKWLKLPEELIILGKIFGKVLLQYPKIFALSIKNASSNWNIPYFIAINLMIKLIKQPLITALKSILIWVCTVPFDTYVLILGLP